MNLRTDLAFEAVDTLKSKIKKNKKYGDIKVIETRVTKELSKSINKKQGGSL